MRRRPVIVRAFLAVLGLALLSGCASTTPIGELLGNPQRYNGRDVTVDGEVTRSVGLLGTGAFEVDDGTGSIFVIAQGQGVPAEGSRTKVRGRFEALFSLLGRSVAAIVQEPRR